MRPVPDDIMKRHREVVVCFDVMYVNGIPFAVSISRALKFGTVEAIKNRKAQTLLNSIKVIQATYARRGFLANRIAADNEFASLEGAWSGMGMALNVVSRGEHVPEIERYIRTLKERCRAVFNTLPFKRIPNRMIAELVYAMNFWLHAFPAQDGVSATMSPREMITGTTIDARKHCMVPFGAYVQTHEEHDNTLATRTIGAIALRPTGNTQGGHFFYSLMTGQRIVRNRWTEVPMPADVISRVERMAGNRAMNRLAFGDRHNDTEAPEEDGDVVSLVSDPGESDDEAEQSDEEEGSPDDELIEDRHTNVAEPRAQPAVKQENAHIKAEPIMMDENAGTGGEPNVNEPEADIGGCVESDPEWTPESHDPATSEYGADLHTPNEIGSPTKQSGEHHATSGDAACSEARNAPSGGNADHRAGVGEQDSATQSSGSEGAVTKVAETTGVRPRLKDRRTMTSHNNGARRGGHTEGRHGNGDKNDADESGTTLEEQMNARYGARTRTGLRSRRKANYDISACKAMSGGITHPAHMLAQFDTTAIAPTFDVVHLANLSTPSTPIIHALLTQYGIKKGLKVFGQQGDDAVNAEMQQLHDLNVMTPKPPSALSKEDRQEALQYLMFLKRKRDGRVKGRGCADGRKQRQDAKKGDASSPTISTEAVFLILTIAAKEGRDVMTMDICGAFLQAQLKGERVHVRFEGRMAELLALIDPKLYRPNIIMEKGKPVLYAELQRALYGMLESTLRFWEQALSDLSELGFSVNPYDWCVANRTINGSQQTVGWHVDGFLVTHVDAKVNDELYEWFNAKCGKRTPVAVHRGTTHNYLGMRVHFTADRKVKVTMTSYIDELLNDAPAEFAGVAPTPAKRHLFDTSHSAAKLDGKRAHEFHHIVAKALFLAKRARPDI
eukprot:TRINITY_DN381_c1_g1_i1.p1 TRINITY_DN381_c1_g1~~TRINITY_DN381_c1_g1_i1.p1  ORF type:complete len:1004 (-),score=118.29 TRINITY_DN381_c1_g1_i1:1292-3985(-)